MKAKILRSEDYPSRWMIKIDGRIMRIDGEIGSLDNSDSYTKETKAEIIEILDLYYHAVYLKTDGEQDTLEVIRKEKS